MQRLVIDGAVHKLPAIEHETLDHQRAIEPFLLRLVEGAGVADGRALETRACWLDRKA